MDLHLTCLIKKEGSQYSSLCLELDSASCGDTKEEAMNSLKDAIDTYIQYMIEENRQDEIYRPVPLEDLREFLVGEIETDKLLKTNVVNVFPVECSI